MDIAAGLLWFIGCLCEAVAAAGRTSYKLT